MAVYAIGDIHGCHQTFLRLLDEISYTPSRDRLWFVGDVVNRGPDSLAMLRWLCAHADNCTLVLGNHDLHLLAVAAGAKHLREDDTIAEILDAPDCADLCEWLRQQPLAHHAHGWLMVHAGVLPAWTTVQTLALAQEAHAVISGREWHDFAPQMYGNKPATWHDNLTGADRLRVIINALTRLRICTAEGEMHLKFTGAPATAPAGLLPWYAAPARKTAHTPMIFGHWSTLGAARHGNAWSIDDGCLWGGTLSALRLEDARLTQVPASG